MDEGGRFEIYCERKFTVGSNPTLSALPAALRCPWRGDRVVEGARLEIVFSAKSANEGSNPSLSATGVLRERR